MRTGKDKFGIEYYKIWNSNPEPIIKFGSDLYDFEIEENVRKGTIVGQVSLGRVSSWCRLCGSLSKRTKVYEINLKN